MHLKCPSGHSRLKQGLHSMSSLSTCACADKRRSELRAAGTEQRQHRPIQRGGQVHQARVVADDQLGAGKQRDSVAEIGAAAQVVAFRLRRAVDFVGDGLVLAGADSAILHSPVAAGAVRSQHNRRPASAWRARTRHPGRIPQPVVQCQVQLLQRGVALRFADCQFRVRQRAGIVALRTLRRAARSVPPSAAAFVC